MKATLIGVGVLAVLVAVTIVRGPEPETGTPSPVVSAAITPSPMNDRHEITISTTHGDIVFRTYDGDAPRTVENFMTLARKGFYDGLIFHRVINGFMIQGGDPKGNGTGGPGYAFADELNPNTESARRGYVRGTVAMANAGPNTNGSQFFIMHEDYPLTHNYTIFGHVVRGQEVVDTIAKVKTSGPPNDRPLEPVNMLKVTVTDLP